MLANEICSSPSLMWPDHPGELATQDYISPSLMFPYNKQAYASQKHWPPHWKDLGSLWFTKRKLLSDYLTLLMCTWVCNKLLLSRVTCKMPLYRCIARQLHPVAMVTAYEIRFHLHNLLS